MQGMGTLRLGSRAVMYTAETLPKGKNRVMGTIQIMTGFMHIGFGIVLTTLTNVYSSIFITGEIPFLGGVSFIISGCLSIGAEKSPTECAVKGSQATNIISAIFALLGIVAFIIDLNFNGLYRSSDDYYSYLVLFCLSFGKAELQRTKSKTWGWWEMGKAISAWGMPSTGHC
eukprot:XP_015156935.2 coiled-coil domain-containing protein 86 isoform X3 [Gallus gallus]